MCFVVTRRCSCRGCVWCVQPTGRYRSHEICGPFLSPALLLRSLEATWYKGIWECELLKLQEYMQIAHKCLRSVYGYEWFCFSFFGIYVCLSHLWSSLWASRSQIRKSPLILCLTGTIIWERPVNQLKIGVLVLFTSIYLHRKVPFNCCLNCCEWLEVVTYIVTFCLYIFIYLHRGCHPQVFQNSAFIFNKSASRNFQFPILA